MVCIQPFHLATRRLIHPDKLPQRMDLIGSLPFEKQLELLEMGRSIFLDIFCSPPSAFRAACYGCKHVHTRRARKNRNSV